MADNYLEKRQESYEEKKKKWEKKHALEILKQRIQKVKAASERVNKEL